MNRDYPIIFEIASKYCINMKMALYMFWKQEDPCLLEMQGLKQLQMIQYPEWDSAGNVWGWR